MTESGLSSVTDSPKAMRSLTNIFGKMRGYNDQKYSTPPRIIKVDAPENIALIENAYNEGVRTKGTVRTMSQKLNVKAQQNLKIIRVKMLK